MKILAAKGYIGTKYATYDKNLLDSYLGDENMNLYLRFASDDEVIKKILKEFSKADISRKKELKNLYQERVNILISSKDFSVKDVDAYSRIPSIEIQSVTTPGYLIATFYKNAYKFEKNGAIILVPKYHYNDIKVALENPKKLVAAFIFRMKFMILSFIL